MCLRVVAIQLLLVGGCVKQGKSPTGSTYTFAELTLISSPPPPPPPRSVRRYVRLITPACPPSPPPNTALLGKLRFQLPGGGGG